MNSGITLDILPLVEQHTKIPLFYKSLTWNPNVTVSYIRCNMDKPWCWEWLGSNSSGHDFYLDIQDMINTKNVILWYWEKVVFTTEFEKIRQLGAGPRITNPNNSHKLLDILLQNHDIPINLKAVCFHASITLDDIERTRSFIDWPWWQLSNNPNLNIAFIKANKQLRWDWHALSCNPGITFEDIIENLDFPWDFAGVSKNPNIIFSQHVLTRSELQWSNNWISSHKNTTLDDVENNLSTFKWCILGLSSNPNLTLQFVLKHKHLAWHWPCICITNNKITYHDIISTINTIPWLWIYVQTRPSLLHINISQDPDALYEVRRHLAAFRIQLAFRQAISNPKYAMCRKRLLSEFQMLAGPSSDADVVDG